MEISEGTPRPTELTTLIVINGIEIGIYILLFVAFLSVTIKFCLNDH
jgi:hypothetical protein